MKHLASLSKLPMSVAFVPSFVIALAATKLIAGQPPQFPYVAYVVESTALVRSGPAERYYATSELPRGAAIEVYRHDGDGWCAVRPPEGSVSLVQAEALRLLDPRVAEAVVDGAPVRVASALGDNRSAVQVQLQHGERVEVLAPATPGSPWVKIAPPAGEFRWIAARSLSRQPPTESTPLPLPAASQWRAYGARRGLTSEAGSASFAAAEGSAEHRSDFSHLQTPNAATAIYDEPLEFVPGSPAAVQATRYEADEAGREAAPAQPIPGTTSAAPPLVEESTAAGASGPEISASGTPRVRFPGRGGEAGPWPPPATARIAELQLELSRAVVVSPDQWRLGGLREETATLLASAASPVEREQLRTLLERIVLFEELAAGRAKLAAANLAPRAAQAPASGTIGSASTPTDAKLDVFDAAEQAATDARHGITGQTETIRELVRRDLGLAGEGAASTAAEQPPAQFTGTEARYDAVGTLKPVVSRRGGAPQYALIDDDGDVVTLLTPGPHVNLQGLVGQRIGVAGSRGFMPEYRRPHVTAERITPLSEGGTTLR
ncbi:MAG: hypothetical protein KF847_04360 [Pirellulales bacterium]|nr:hypothetical protein [Pirellulales bacterium]